MFTLTTLTILLILILVAILFFQIYFISIGVSLNDFKKLLVELNLNFKPIRALN